LGIFHAIKITKQPLTLRLQKRLRPRPPFCIQPTHPFVPVAVETVTELDVIYATRDIAHGDKSVLVV
jgi:hypothetical protein